MIQHVNDVPSSQETVMQEVTDSQQAPFTHRHVQLINEQVHIDDVGDFDCKQVSIDQCTMVSNPFHITMGILLSIGCLGLSAYMFWMQSMHPTHNAAWAPLFLLVTSLYLGWQTYIHRKHYQLMLHTDTMGDLQCEASIEDMDELKHHVKLKCRC